MVSSPQPDIFEVQPGYTFGDVHCQFSSDTILIHWCWRLDSIGHPATRKPEPVKPPGMDVSYWIL